MGSKRLIHILTKILIKFIEVGLETLFFGNGRGSFGRIELAGQKGPPLLGKGGHYFRKISTQTRPVSPDPTLLAHSAESIP